MKLRRMIEDYLDVNPNMSIKIRYDNKGECMWEVTLWERLGDDSDSTQMVYRQTAYSLKEAVEWAIDEGSSYLWHTRKVNNPDRAE